MKMEEIISIFEKQREYRSKEKGKFITLPIKQLDYIEEDYAKSQDKIRKLQDELKSMEEKLNEARTKRASWSAKYTNLANKTKEELYEEFKERNETKLKSELEWKLDYKRQEMETKYLKKEKELVNNIDNIIEQTVKKRIEKLENIRDDFSKRLSEEKDRYEEKHDLESEKNQGYLIGIAKTRKELINAFNEVIGSESNG